jgi:hypothetical protein
MFLLAVASIVGILTNRDKMRHILSYVIDVEAGRPEIPKDIVHGQGQDQGALHHEQQQ